MISLNIVDQLVGALLGILGLAILVSAVGWRLWQMWMGTVLQAKIQSDLVVWFDIGGILLCLGMVLLAEPTWLRSVLVVLSVCLIALLIYYLIRRTGALR